MAELLDADELARAARFRFEADRVGFVTLHAAARILLAAITGLAPAALAFRREPDGKPVLATASGLHFSLSRTRGVALVGIATAPIGVDVEAVRPVSDAAAITARYFARSEATGLDAIDAVSRTDAFFAVWSRKEAVVKALGLGLTKPLDSFEVGTDPSRPALLSMDGDHGAASSWSIWGRRLDTAWAAAAAARPGVAFRPALLDMSAWQ